MDRLFHNEIMEDLHHCFFYLTLIHVSMLKLFVKRSVYL